MSNVESFLGKTNIDLQKKTIRSLLPESSTKGLENLKPKKKHPKKQSVWGAEVLTSKPIGSMYGIFTYIWLNFMVNVVEYTSPMDPMGNGGSREYRPFRLSKRHGCAIHLGSSRFRFRDICPRFQRAPTSTLRMSWEFNH